MACPEVAFPVATVIEHSINRYIKFVNGAWFQPDWRVHALQTYAGHAHNANFRGTGTYMTRQQLNFEAGGLALAHNQLVSALPGLGQAISS